MSEAAATPKHLWIIGIISLLWNMMGAYDYLMTQIPNESYMAKFDQAQLDYFYNLPTWLVFFWALAVWSSVLGSALLLMRKRVAERVFMASFVSMVTTVIYEYGFSNGFEVRGSTGLVFTLVIFFIALGLWLYARAMRVRDVLA